MTTPKKHHFVPRWYLERFADDKGFLYLYDRHKTEWRRQRPSEVMTVTHYYRQLWTPEDIDPNILEKSLGSTMEPNAKRAFERLNSDPQSLTAEDTAEALVYLEFQRLRVPRQAHIAKQLFRSTILMHSPPDAAKAIFDGSVQLTIKDSFRFEYMRMLIGSLHPWFGRMGWEVVQAHADCAFVTTDSPVSFFNVRFLPPNEAGLGLVGTIVLFPLDSSHLLMLKHPEYSYDGDADPTRRLPEPDVVDGHLAITSGGIWDEEQVARLNWTMLQLSGRVVVAKSKTILEQCVGYAASEKGSLFA